jgi:DNA repair protein RAD50
MLGYRVVLTILCFNLLQKTTFRALVKYHATKMEEINKIIKELWQATYKGSDISTIEIRADSEETSGRRNYNYRVLILELTTKLLCFIG